jgi:hypothetical protein
MIKGGQNGMEPEEVGEVIAKALMVAHPKTRYAVVKGKFVNVTIPSLLPKRFVDRMMGNQLGLIKK